MSLFLVQQAPKRKYAGTFSTTLLIVDAPTKAAALRVFAPHAVGGPYRADFTAPTAWPLELGKPYQL